jgi:homocysteine S-methyltransferase
MMHSKSIDSLLHVVPEKPWLADGGLETVMVFLEGLDLPQFASFPLVNDPQGRDALTRYFTSVLDAAAGLQTGVLLDTATWRASYGWGRVMGLGPDDIDTANRAAVAFALGLRDLRPGQDIVINGVIGPHGDAYAPDVVMDAKAAQDYHTPQVRVLAAAGVDIISAMTISTTGEAIGIAQAARMVGLPVALSFTLETDGRLVGGMDLRDAISQTDAETGGYPAWFGVNCVHPDHFRAILDGPWVNRIGAIRANASRLSHAELDEATELDAGNPEELGRQYAELQSLLPGLRVVGGCCGTDIRHLSAIGRACVQHAH